MRLPLTIVLQMLLRVSVYMNIRNFLRGIRRFFWRTALRLRGTHPTFLCGGYSNIEKDFIAEAYSYVGPGSSISSGVSIGAYTMLGPGVMIIGNDHIFDAPGIPIIFSGRPEFKRTSIGRDVWIGARAIIMCGVRIGDGAIVASGAVVTRDVEPFEVVAGVPARRVRMRFLDEDVVSHKAMLFLPPKEGAFCQRR